MRRLRSSGLIKIGVLIRFDDATLYGNRREGISGACMNEIIAAKPVLTVSFRVIHASSYRDGVQKCIETQDINVLPSCIRIIVSTVHCPAVIYQKSSACFSRLYHIVSSSC